MKLHPLFHPYLEGGEPVEWGAKTIPEGGFYAIPHRRHGNGIVVLGDAAGYVEVASLKASTMPSSRGSSLRARSSTHSRRATPVRPRSRRTTTPWMAATSAPTSTSAATCGLRSRTDSTWAA
ncbi:MAG: hypothetical protein ACRELX_05785 [Longimicrobiales bacterium]